MGLEKDDPYGFLPVNLPRYSRLECCKRCKTWGPVLVGDSEYRGICFKCIKAVKEETEKRIDQTVADSFNPTFVDRIMARALRFAVVFFLVFVLLYEGLPVVLAKFNASDHLANMGIVDWYVLAFAMTALLLGFVYLLKWATAAMPKLEAVK